MGMPQAASEYLLGQSSIGWQLSRLQTHSHEVLVARDKTSLGWIRRRACRKAGRRTTYAQMLFNPLAALAMGVVFALKAPEDVIAMAITQIGQMFGSRQRATTRPTQ